MFFSPKDVTTFTGLMEVPEGSFEESFEKIVNGFVNYYSKTRPYFTEGFIPTNCCDRKVMTYLFSPPLCFRYILISLAASTQGHSLPFSMGRTRQNIVYVIGF